MQPMPGWLHHQEPLLICLTTITAIHLAQHHICSRCNAGAYGHWESGGGNIQDYSSQAGDTEVSRTQLCVALHGTRLVIAKGSRGEPPSHYAHSPYLLSCDHAVPSRNPTCAPRLEEPRHAGFPMHTGFTTQGPAQG